MDPTGRWLLDGNGRPVFLLADTAWALCMKLRRSEIEEYLRTRRAQRFNSVAFVAMNPVWAENAYGAKPFVISGGKMDVARPATTPRATPGKMPDYDYWDHVDFAIERTRRLGMYAIFLPAWGSAVAGSYTGAVTDEIVFDSANAYVYGNWLGRRYSGQKHIVWMLGGDRSAVYGDKDYRPVIESMAEGIADGVQKISAHDSKADYSSILMSYHPRKQHPQSSEWFHTAAWLKFNSIQHWPEDQIAAIERDWRSAPPKPTWLFEGRYEAYWKSDYRPEQWGEWQVRYQAWQTVLAGAFGHTYGHERVFGFGKEDWTGKDGWNWRKELASPGATSMTHLARFMNSLGRRNLLSRVPDQSLVDGDAGNAERLTSNRISAMSSADSRLAVFYSANGRPIRIRMDKLAPGPMFAWWFNPRNGKWFADGKESAERRRFAAGLATGPGASVRELDPPGEAGEGRDWILVLSAVEGP